MTEILTAYFSRKGENYISGHIVNLPEGNTSIVAKKIHSLAGGDLLEIKTIKAYPVGYFETTKIAKVELQDKKRPPLREMPANIDKYDTILLGFPIWWNNIPAPILTFLEKYDFAGKTIIPFCTHEGGNLGASEAVLKKLCPNSVLKPGIAVRGSEASKSDELIKNELRLRLYQ